MSKVTLAFECTAKFVMTKNILKEKKKTFGGCSLLKIKLPIILSNKIKHNHDYFQRQSFYMFDGALKDDNSTKTSLSYEI